MKRGLVPEMTLGRWFLLWMVLVTVLALGLSVAVVTLHQHAELERRLVGRGRAVARTLALAAAEPGSPPLAITAVPECVAARVDGPRGELLWSYGPGLGEAEELDPSLIRVEEAVAPPGAEPSATVRVVLLLSAVQIRAQVLGTGARLAATLCVALAVALVLGALLLNGVVEPLRHLAAWVRTFHPDQPPEVRLPERGASEISELAAAFAQMGMRLADQRRSIAASERRFRELFEASPTPILELDGELGIRGANPAAAPFLGCDVLPAEGMQLSPFLVDLETLPEPPADEGDEVVVETTWALPGGEPAEVELHLRQVLGEAGPSYLMAIHDLTDRVRRLGERWRRTFDEMEDGVALVDLEGAITVTNRAIEPHLEVLRAEVAARAGGGGERHEWLVGSGDRSLRCGLTGATGSERILVVRDVTDWLRAEERLREAQKMEAVATLAGGVAHDFNNLLTGILLHVRLLERDPETADEAVEAIRVLAEEGADVVRSLLHFAQPEATPRRGLDLAALVAEQEPLLRHLLPSSIALELCLEPPPAPVLASPGDLRRVLLNLVLNARNALGTDGGEVTVTVGAEAGMATMAVSDSGPGIPPELRERVFEPFFTLRRGGRGAGIGLAVVYAIARDHDGEVTVATAEQGGARFEVRLPLRPDLTVDNAPESTETEEDDLSGRGEEVLLVEDETAVRERLAEELSAAGYRVRVAEGAAAARALCAEGEAQALVLDLILADGRGSDLARELRARLGEVPVVFITGHLDAGDDDGLALPGTVVLEKPFPPEDLLRALRRLLLGGS